MREALHQARDLRPVLDTEHGPIHAFIDRHQTLPEAFDDEYFRHMQWAHLASGGAGGGMRWPNRHPHVLTPGMRRAQRALSDFLPLVDWPRFRRRNLNQEVVAPQGLAAFACGDDRQAVLWLLRTDACGPDGRIVPRADAAPQSIEVPGLAPGDYRMVQFDTQRGAVTREDAVHHGGGLLALRCGPIASDVALVLQRAPTAAA